VTKLGDSQVEYQVGSWGEERRRVDKEGERETASLAFRISFELRGGKTGIGFFKTGRSAFE